ncbi:MerR HTH family regulatory protein [Pricia antarctica]|uniref:MerR HTH family regulatory protein n=1 Tax=Pricia antarctica TaxID=641691 RepID=A0A1G7BL74_9FLAO|nr:chaperone modulator CbpM [Pricia antarctica]SDE27667.1 MerR HTH family regulatory protein [Pricia antarctica]
MKKENYILVRHYCKRTHIPDAFIKALNEYGLIHYKQIETEIYILDEEIPEIERFDRLHNDLGINLEGIDALNHMLSRLRNMESEMNTLRKRLRLYE